MVLSLAALPGEGQLGGVYGFRLQIGIAGVDY
jgi:hypothetical protein